MHSIQLAKRGVLSALLVVGLCLPAFAQEFAGIEEIVVTATKREESIQDVPLAVTALSSQQLERVGVKSLEDLPLATPSFHMNQSQYRGGTTFRVRGVGTTGNNAGLESAVGVFIDGIYQSRPGQTLEDLVDIEQIEVLRGPQGTLFGRNTSAGALSIRTKKPSLEENDAWINFTRANYNSLTTQLGFNSVINDQLAFRFAGSWREADGTITGVGRRERDVESHNINRYSVRGQLYWENNDLDLRVIGDYAALDERCCDAVVLYETFNPGFVDANGDVTAPGVSVFGDEAVEDRKSSNNEEFGEEGRQWGISLEANYDISDSIKLTFLAGHRYVWSHSAQESDFTDIDLFYVTDSLGDGDIEPAGETDLFSAELRLQGDLEFGMTGLQGLDWMVGAYFSNEDIETYTPLQLGADYDANAIRLLAAAGGANTVTGVSGGESSEGSYAVNRFDQEGDSWSLFTHNVLHVTDTLDIVAGLRWIDESKDGSFEQLEASSAACVNTYANAQAVGEAVAAGASAQSVAAGGPAFSQERLDATAAAVRDGALLVMCFPFTIDIDTLTRGTGDMYYANSLADMVAPREFDDTFEDDELTYTAKLAWTPELPIAALDSINLYAGFTHGFKAGGFNLDPASAVDGADPRFDSEVIDSIELGIKSDWLGNTLRANLTVFMSEMEDFQILEWTGVRFQTFNVAEATSDGVEVELFYSPIEGLNTSAAVTYVDAEYPDDCAEGLPSAVATTASALCGGPLTNASEWTGVVSASWESELPNLPLLEGLFGSGAEYFISTSVRFESERRTSTQWRLSAAPDAALLRGDWQSGNAKMNLRIGFSSEDGSRALELWGNNIFDRQTRYVTFNLPLRGSGAAGNAARGTFLEAPATYGATLRFRF